MYVSNHNAVNPVIVLSNGVIEELPDLRIPQSVITMLPSIDRNKMTITNLFSRMSSRLSEHLDENGVMFVN